MYISSTITIGAHVFEYAGDHSCRELAFSAMRGSFWNSTINTASIAGRTNRSAYSHLYEIHNENERKNTQKSNDYYYFRFALLDAIIKSPIAVTADVQFGLGRHTADITDVIDRIKAYDTVQVEYSTDECSWNKTHGIKLTGDITTFPAFFWAAKQFRGDEWSSSALAAHAKMDKMDYEHKLFIARFMLASGEGPQDSVSSLRNATPQSATDRVQMFAQALQDAGGIEPSQII